MRRVGVEMSKSEIAIFYGVNINTITQWIAKGCPFVQKGGPGKKWILSSLEVTQWREEQITAAAVGDVSQLDINEARRRKLAAEAAMTELDLAHRRGDLIEIEFIADMVGNDYANMRAKLLALPTKLAPQLVGMDDPVECTALLDKGVTEALEELTADEIYCTEGPDSDSVTGQQTDGKEAGKPRAAA